MTEPPEERELSFDQRLGEAELPEDTVDICMRGDLVAVYHGLQQRIAAIPDPPAGSGSLAGNGAKIELQQQLEAVASAMRRSTQTFRLRALGKKPFGEFLLEHPPRPADRRDMMAGYNVDTMGPALLRRCVVDPVVTAQQWDKLESVLSTGEWSKLDKAAQVLNFSEVNVPF